MNRLEARENILNMKEPFCITDLFYKMEQKGCNNRKMILQLLDELYDDKLIKYVRIYDNPNTEGAFVVDD